MSVVLNDKPRQSTLKWRWPLSRELTLSVATLAVLLAVCIGSFGFDTFTEKVLDIPAGSVGGGALGPDAADRPLYPRLRQ